MATGKGERGVSPRESSGIFCGNLWGGLESFRGEAIVCFLHTVGARWKVEVWRALSFAEVVVIGAGLD